MRVAALRHIQPPKGIRGHLRIRDQRTAHALVDELDCVQDAIERERDEGSGIAFVGRAEGVVIRLAMFKEDEERNRYGPVCKHRCKGARHTAVSVRERMNGYERVTGI